MIIVKDLYMPCKPSWLNRMMSWKKLCLTFFLENRANCLFGIVLLLVDILLIYLIPHCHLTFTLASFALHIFTNPRFLFSSNFFYCLFLRQLFYWNLVWYWNYFDSGSKTKKVLYCMSWPSEFTIQQPLFCVQNVKLHP